MSSEHSERIDLVIEGDRVFRMFKSPKTRIPGKELWESLGDQHVLGDVVRDERMHFKERDGLPPTITTPVAEIEADGMNAYIVKTAGGTESRGSIYRLVVPNDKQEPNAEGITLAHFNPMALARRIGEAVQKVLRN